MPASVYTECKDFLSQISHMNMADLDKERLVIIKNHLTALSEKVDSSLKGINSRLATVNSDIKTLENRVQLLSLPPSAKLEQARLAGLEKLQAEKKSLEAKIPSHTEMKGQLTAAIKSIPSTSCCSTRAVAIATVATAVLAAGTGLVIKYYN